MRAVGVSLLAIICLALGAASSEAQIRLPDGRMLTPAGRMVSAGDFPAAALIDGGTLLTPAAGETLNQLVSVDTATLTAAGTSPAPDLPPATDAAPWALSGTEALDATNDRVYLGAGALDQVDVFSVHPFPTQLGTLTVPGWAGGVAVSQDGSRLYVTIPFDSGAPFGKGSRVVALSTALGSTGGLPSLSSTVAGPVASAKVGAHPLAILDGVVHGREVVAVANRDSGTVSILDAHTLQTIATVATGRQPAALAVTAGGDQLLVLDSLDDSMTAVSTALWRVTSRTDLSDRFGLGAAPSALALSSDGTRAYVALSMDNAVAVLDRGPRGWSVAGRIPTAWYPTGVAVDAAHGQLLVTAGKGVGAPPGLPVGLPVADRPVPNPGSAGLGGSGTVEAIPLPDAATLRGYTRQVAADEQVPCRDCRRPLALRGITHVVYIIRENKTYDEEFGDEPGGAPAGLLYGRRITSNTHAIADRYVLLERFFADEEVSDTGHQAVMGSVSNDWVERFAQQAYGIDGAPRPGAELGNDDSVLWSPSDYLFDGALAHGVSFRDYGEFYRHNQSADTGAAVTPELDSHIVHDFPGFGFDPTYPDTGRAAFWVAQFHQDVARRSFPSLEVIYLPEDHTTQGFPASATLAGTVQSTPQWQVADSDLATGQIIAALSRSPYWNSTAVFLTEDDPQSGIDHVDEHRTVGLIAGGRVRQGVRSRRHFDQASMLRTIEEILGLPPLTQFDATANPMDALFTTRADAAPFTALTPAPVRLGAAQIQAINARARTRLGAHPSFDAVSPVTQLALQWQAVRGTAPPPR